MRRAGLLVLVVSLVGCGALPPGGVDDDAGEPITPEVDAGRDAGETEPEPEPEPIVDAGTSDAGPTTVDAGSPLRIAVLSDLNGSYGATTYESTVHAAVTALTGTLKPDVVLISGDMVAGQQAGLNYPAMWAGFHAAVTTKLLAAGIVVAPSPGNHDASAYAGYAAERAEYERQWKPSRVPKATMLDGSQFPFRYSFAVKDVLFLALDATTIAPLSGAQRAWVDQQLTQHGPTHPVRIVFGHVPIHPTTVGRETEVLNDAAFEAILAKHQALFVGGHQHGYYPGVAGGVRQVVAPCLGSGPRPLIGSSVPAARGFVLIDVARNQIRSLEARTGATYGSTIARSSLPAQLVSGAHRLIRDDR